MEKSKALTVMHGDKGTRKIIHVDMDAFFASVEQRDNPGLRGKPIAVGSPRTRGVVAAASYEARKYGVRSAMPSGMALQKCPGLIFVAPRFDAYKQVSLQVRAILERFTDLIEPLSIDEAYLDVTTNKLGMKSATHIAMRIKEMIKSETGLTASAGVSMNKLLAKIASDVNKPDGLFVIPPGDALSFIEKLPVSKIYGIGKATTEKMRRLNIFTGKDLKERDEYELIRHFGKAGRWFYQISRGIDQRPVNPARIRKSVGAECTFEEDLQGREEMIDRLKDIARQVWRRAVGKSGRTVTLKLRYPDFETLTRSKTLPAAVTSENHLLEVTTALLQSVEKLDKARLLGITLSNFPDEEERFPKQLTLEF